MRCKNARKNISVLIDGEPAPDIRDKIREKLRDHLASCEACRTHLSEASAVWDMLVLPDPEPAPYLYTRIRARIESGTRISRAGGWERLLLPAAGAAVLALGIFLGSRIDPNEQGGTVLTAEEFFGPLDRDVFQDFPAASLGAVYLTYALGGGEE
ncbi:MAG TPA: zf-HC2 domain-containing protein [bacterium]|nr:zf-HC2 domain-containing protein [bacterium]